MDAEDMALVDEHLSQGGFLTLLEEDADGNLVERATRPPSRSVVAATRLEDQDAAWMCPFVPSSARRIDRFLERVCPALTEEDAVYDLGCGDGRMLIELAKRSTCTCVGVDIDPKLVASARNAEEQAAAAATAAATAVAEHRQAARHENKIIWLCQDIRGMALEEPRATVVVIYLVPSALKLIQEWVHELWSTRSDLTLVMFVYRFEGWTPDEVDVNYGISVYHCRDATHRKPFSFLSSKDVVAAGIGIDIQNGPVRARGSSVVTPAAATVASAGTSTTPAGAGANAGAATGGRAGDAAASKSDSESSDDDCQPPSGIVIQGLFDDSSCESESSDSDSDEPDAKPGIKSVTSWRQTGLRGALAGKPRRGHARASAALTCESESSSGEEEEGEPAFAAVSTQRGNFGVDLSQLIPSGDMTDATAASESTPAAAPTLDALPVPTADEAPNSEETAFYPIADPDFAVQTPDEELALSSPSPFSRFDTQMTADSTEFCPVPGFESVCVVATYELKGESRLGSLSVLDTNGLSADTPRPSWEGSGVLDCKWASSPVSMSNRGAETAPLLAAVHANGTMTMHRLERSDCNANGTPSRLTLTEVCAGVGTEGGPMFLSLDFDDRHERSRGGPLSVVVSQWDGCVSLWDVTAADRASSNSSSAGGGSSKQHGSDGENSGPRCVRVWDAHRLPGGQVAEAWIAAFDCWHTKTVLTGGDDGALYGWDLRAPGRPSTRSATQLGGNKGVDIPPLKVFARHYDAGVCSVQFDEFREHRVAVGGYFGAVEILDLRALASAGSLATAMVTPLNRWETGGGVWRLKWHPSRVGLLASACMRGGIRIFRDLTWAPVGIGDGGGIGSAIGEGAKDLHGLVCRYTGHPGEALAYGVSWQRRGRGGGGGGGLAETGVGGGLKDTIASCSFYDRALHFWKV